MGIKRARQEHPTDAGGDGEEKRTRLQDTAGKAEFVWIKLDGKRPTNIPITSGMLIDDLKPMIKAKCAPIFDDINQMDLLVSLADGQECLEDAEVTSFTQFNSASNPLIISVYCGTGTTDSGSVCLPSDAPKTTRIASPKSEGPGRTVYLELVEGISDKFYELKQDGSSVTIRYGRRGASGMMSTKSFSTEAEAAAFVAKTAKEKRGKGYIEISINCESTTHASHPEELEADEAPSGDLRADLESGKKVLVRGSGKAPYTLRKFRDGQGYSCSCYAFVMNIKKNGIQANTCKHLKLIRGEEAEAMRCAEFAGVNVAAASAAATASTSTTAGRKTASDKNGEVTKKISLAHAWKPTHDPKGFIMSEKLDGMRAYWSGGKLWTRSGGLIITPEWFLSGLPQDTELDGELFLGRQKFDECMSIARRTDASDDWKRLTYVIFDAPGMKGGISARLATIANMIGENTPHAKIHPQEVCLGIDHLLEELARVEQLGGEGLMIRSPHAEHRGGRTTDLLKVKSFHDAEALVTDHEEGKGKYKGMVGSLVCILKDGSIFKVGSGLADNERSYQSAPRPGTVITFKYFELTKDGIPRFPTFLRVRPDVTASEFPRPPAHR